MILAFFTDIVWQAIIAAVVTIVLAWMNARTKIAVEAASKINEVGVAQAAHKVDDVKTALEVSDQRTDKKLDTIHALVNSNMSVQLKLTATALRRVAQLDPTAETIAAVDVAEKALHDHEKALQEYIARQAEVDAKKSPLKVTLVQSDIVLPVRVEGET